MEADQKDQSTHRGPKIPQPAPGKKRVLTSQRDTGSRWQPTWTGPRRRWTGPGPEELARRPADHRCPVCGHNFPYVWDGLERAWYATHGDPCQECARLAFVEQTMAEARAATLRRYGLDAGRYAQMTLDKYRPDPAYPSQAEARHAVRALVDTWAGGDWSAGILLSSPDVGIGKTHLAIAAAREGVMLYKPRMDELLLAVWDMPSFVDAVRHTYRDDRMPDPIVTVQEPVIVLLDDVGSEHVTAQGRSWYEDLMFRLINPRWLAGRATIVTTNLDYSALSAWLGERVRSRLIQLAGKPVVMRGRDHRLRSLSTPHPNP